MATFLVINSNDSGTGSLRQALADAEANGTGADTIEFASWLLGETIALQSTLVIQSGTVTINGDMDGDGDADITISGNNDGDTGMGAGDIATLLAVNSGATVAIDGLDMAYAYSKGTDGTVYGTVSQAGTDGVAGITNLGNLTISHSVLSNMMAIGGAMGGTADTAEDAAGAFAGILSLGTLTLEDVRMESFYARGADGADTTGPSNDAGEGGSGATGISSTGVVNLSAVSMNNFYSYGGTGGDTATANYGGTGGDVITGVFQYGGAINGYLYLGNMTRTSGAAGTGGLGLGLTGSPFYVQSTGGATANVTTLSAGQAGTDGDDHVTVGAGGYFLAFAGDDVIDNSAGGGIIYGGGGRDVIISGGAGALINAGTQDDRVAALNFADGQSFDGGKGTDVFDASAVTGQDLVADLQTGIASSGVASMTILNFENFVGSDDAASSDNVTGTSGDNTFLGLAGDDVLDGAGGDDLIYGDDGADTLLGGDGNDELHGGNGGDGIGGGAGNDLIYGDDGDDTLSGNNGNDRLEGGAGSDILNGGGGRDTLFGGADADALKGIGGNDKIFGEDGNDTLIGGGGRDRVKGGAGQDTIRGGGGNDFLYGDAGNDLIFGDKGRDKMRGGGGNDTFVFKKKSGNDVILDFHNNQDTLRIDHHLWQGKMTARDIAYYFSTVEKNGDITLHFSSNDSVTIHGLHSLKQLIDDIQIV
ncbi:MAG: hypothetical protein H6873_11750 [Hyphomicrobiaceae bacterium]|nr:hypothetical protein [Hyphomicrobiaceae bacterium]